MKKENFGINVQLNHKNKKQLDKYISLLDELNVGWVRLRFDFYSYTKSRIDFRLYDYFIKNLLLKKIKILGSLMGSVPGTVFNLIHPRWNRFFNPLDSFNLYRQFVSDVCNRYRKKISYWTIWNEPNTKRMWIRKPSASEYTLLVKQIHPLIKKIDVNNKIVLGPISCFSWGGKDNFQNYFRGLIRHRIDDFIDIYAFNPYFFGNYFTFNNSKEYQVRNLKSIIASFIKIYQKNRLKKPIWITEMGVSDRWVRLSSKQIGEIYTEMLNFSLKNNIKNVFIWNFFDFIDDCYSKLNPERFFGIVRNNLVPKESFAVLREFFSVRLSSDRSKS